MIVRNVAKPISYIQATFFIICKVVGSADKNVMEWIAPEAGSFYTACILSLLLHITQ